VSCHIARVPALATSPVLACLDKETSAGRATREPLDQRLISRPGSRAGVSGNAYLVRTDPAEYARWLQPQNASFLALDKTGKGKTSFSSEVPG
jgi:hypothetical protein